MSEIGNNKQVSSTTNKYDIGEIKRYVKSKYNIRPSAGDYIQNKYDLEERTKRAVKSYQRMGIYDIMMHEQKKILQRAAPNIDINQVQTRYHQDKGAIYFSQQTAKQNLERRIKENADDINSSLQIIGNDKYLFHVQNE